MTYLTARRIKIKITTALQRWLDDQEIYTSPYQDVEGAHIIFKELKEEFKEEK